MRLRSTAAALFTALLLGACATLPGAEPGAAPAQLLTITQSPADVVRTFFDAWGRSDYPAMYALIAPQSQRLTPQAVFETAYRDADARIGTQGITYRLRPTREQGSSAEVPHDLTIESALFGAVVDDGRLMRLVRVGSDWRIAWSSLDIIAGFAPGTRLSVDSRRQPRANIYDRAGRPMVEQNADVVEVYVARGAIPNYDACLDTLSVILRINRRDLITTIDAYNADTVFPVGDLDPDVWQARQAELISQCAVRTSERTTRRYAGHGIATHAIGYLGSISAEQLEAYQARGYTADDLIGLMGVEAAYEETLAGRAERVLRITEPGGLIVRELAGTSGEAPQPLQVTLDLNLQWVAAQALSDAFNYAAGNWATPGRSPGGGAIVLDVNTGAILAVASYPTFDPGIFNPDTPIFFVGDQITRLRNDPRNFFTNRVTQEQYPPGSVFKIVTTAAAAEENLWSPTALFDCGMEWYGRDFGDTSERRLDWRATEVLEEARYATGQVTISEALAASCNPFFYQMGATLFNRAGAGALNEYSRRMGLGAPTGIGSIMPEAAGQLPRITSADGAISSAIGQSDTQVTILQMARLTAGIANGGTLYRPYLVGQVGGFDGTPVSFGATPTVDGEMGLSEATLAIVREGMCMVTRDEARGRSTGEPLGTAWFVFDSTDTGIAPYSVCAKTGTAQTGRVEPHGWFVAYAPADEPQIAVAVMIEHSREGSETAAPIVRRIMDAYFNAPRAPYPRWWAENEYVPLNIPSGATGG